jgi:hypothetical protein
MEQVLSRVYLPELSVEALVGRLARCLTLEEALARALGEWLPRVGDRSLSSELLVHLERDERHGARLRLAVEALRDFCDGATGRRSDPETGRSGFRAPGARNQEPGARSAAVDPDLRHWLDQMLGAENEVEWLAGIYGVVKPVLADAYRDLLAATDGERDRDLCDLLRAVLDEEEAQIEWGLAQMRRRAVHPAARCRADDWAEYLRLGLRAAGDIWGDMPRRHAPLRPGFSDRRP